MRLRLLDRYLLTGFLRTFAITVISAPLLFVLAEITVQLDAFLARGMSAREILLLYPPQIPTYVTWAFPIAALIGTLFTLQPLARHGELHAAVGCGIPIQRLYLPLFVGGAVASLAVLMLLELTPMLVNRSTAVAVAPTARVPASRGAFAYRTDRGDFLSAQGLTVGVGAELTGVVLRSPVDSNRDRTQFIVAESATWDLQGGWVLHKGSTWTVDSGTPRSVVPFEHLALPFFSEPPQSLLEAQSVDLATMSFVELGRFAERLERSGSAAAYPRTKQWERVAIPIITLVIIAFAAPLATLSHGTAASAGPALALMSLISYLALSRASEGLGIAGILQPALATLLPALVFGIAGLLLLRRTRT